MGEVLSSIDATLAGADEDWGVSGDAMRWTPGDAPPVESELDHAVKQLTRFGEIWSGAAQSFCDQAAAAFGPVMGAESNGDSIPVRLSPAESAIPGPNGRPLHIRHAYGDQPVEITEIDMDDLENDDRSTT